MLTLQYSIITSMLTLQYVHFGCHMCDTTKFRVYAKLDSYWYTNHPRPSPAYVHKRNPLSLFFLFASLYVVGFFGVHNEACIDVLNNMFVQIYLNFKLRTLSNTRKWDTLQEYWIASLSLTIQHSIVNTLGRAYVLIFGQRINKLGFSIVITNSE